ALPTQYHRRSPAPCIGATPHWLPTCAILDVRPSLPPARRPPLATRSLPTFPSLLRGADRFADLHLPVRRSLANRRLLREHPLVYRLGSERWPAAVRSPDRPGRASATTDRKLPPYPTVTRTHTAGPGLVL